jgi:ssDNA-binding Zn-finger/Zn-ribbon topoisomerase 1
MTEHVQRRKPNGWSCPHCSQNMVIRSSKTMHPLMRTYYLRCEDFTCGATFVADMEITQQLSPSGVPNDQIANQLESVSRRSSGLTGDVPQKKAPFSGVDHMAASGQRIEADQESRERKLLRLNFPAAKQHAYKLNQVNENENNDPVET